MVAVVVTVVVVLAVMVVVTVVVTIVVPVVGADSPDIDTDIGKSDRRAHIGRQQHMALTRGLF